MVKPTGNSSLEQFSPFHTAIIISFSKMMYNLGNLSIMSNPYSPLQNPTASVSLFPGTKRLPELNRTAFSTALFPYMVVFCHLEQGHCRFHEMHDLPCFYGRKYVSCTLFLEKPQAGSSSNLPNTVNSSTLKQLSFTTNQHIGKERVAQ